jgi:acetyl esterase
MKNQIIFFIFIIGIITAHAQNLKEYKIVSSYKDTVEVYKTVAEKKLHAYIFSPTEIEKSDERPVILFFHDGGWFEGTHEGFFRKCRRYASKGWVTISFEYRLSNHKDINPIHCIMDARSAVRWARKNAQHLHINPDKIVVAGQSAGGHLALSTAFGSSFNEKSDDLAISCIPNAVVCFSSCYDTKRAPWFISLLPKEINVEKTSPYYNITSTAPPLLMFHTKKDEIVAYEQAADFNRRMHEKRNYCELITFEEGSHVLFPMYGRNIDMITEDFLIRMGFLIE